MPPLLRHGPRRPRRSDGDREFDFDEFLSTLEKARAIRLADDAKKLMDKADKDGSGRLEFDEFHDAVVDHIGSEDNDTVDFQMLVRKKALADIRDAATGRLFLLVFLLYPSLVSAAHC